MKVYLVGGAVRDQQLNLTVTERDWVVVGATPKQLLAEGYQQVGKDFPVFIHPKTGEEYALARTERKVGQGYDGFTCFADPSVTLEEDLMRRDLSINAMAIDDGGNIIDPYGGLADLKHRCLRHVSDAFFEDPLRILRIARFAARLPDFQVAKSTMQLLKEMVEAGELRALTKERVWQELVKALLADEPRRFIQVLASCGALVQLDWHWEVEDWDMVEAPCCLPIRFALICRFLAEEHWQALLAQLPLPTECKRLAKRLRVTKSWREHGDFTAAPSLMALLESVDAWRQDNDLWLATLRCAYPKDALQWDFIHEILPVLRSVHLTAQESQGILGPAYGQALRQKRLAVLNDALMT